VVFSLFSCNPAVLCSFHSPEDCPLLWASTYEAGNCIKEDAKSGKVGTPARHDVTRQEAAALHEPVAAWASVTHGMPATIIARGRGSTWCVLLTDGPVWAVQHVGVPVLWVVVQQLCCVFVRESERENVGGW
jgi:hypothetical protein